MSEIVTVALVGHPKHWGDESLPEAREMPWEDRVKADVELGDGGTLATVFDRAAAALGVELPEVRSDADRVSDLVPYVAFYREHADRPTDSSPRQTHLTLLDDSGKARWKVPLPDARDLPYTELLRAGDAGALEGDPRRVYLFPTMSSGNGILINWASWLHALEVAWPILEGLAAAEGGISFTERVVRAARAALGRTKEVEQAHSRDWAERGLDPHGLDVWLGGRSWSAETLSRHLACTPPEAEAVLTTRGLEFDDEAGVWRPSESDAAQLLRRTGEEIELSYNLDYQAFDGILEKRIAHLIREGRSAVVPGTDYSPDDLRDRAEELYDEAPPLEERPDFENDHELDTRIDDYRERMRIPTDHLLLRCGCGKDGCTVAARFGVANGQLKIGFTEPTDHFVTEGGYLSGIAEQIATDIQKAKRAESVD